MSQRRIQLDLELEIKKFLQASTQAAKAAVKTASDVTDSWNNVGTTMRGVAKAAAGIFVIQEVLDYTNELAAARTEVINLSKATGISTQTLGAFQLAASRSGVEVSEILGGFEDFGEVLFDFTQGGGRAEEALRMLGYTSGDLSGRLGDVDGVAVELIEKMRGIEDAGLRNAVAQQLFGDAGNRLNAILGDAPLEEWITAAQDLGVTVDEDAAQATERWNQATAILGETLSQTGGDLVTFLQPVASELIISFSRGFEMIQAAAVEAFAVVGERVQGFVALVRALYRGDFAAAFDEGSALIARQITDWERIGNAALDAGRDFNDTQATVDRTTQSLERQSTALKSLTDDTEAQREAQRRLKEETRQAKEAHDQLRQVLEFDRRLADELATAHEALGDIAVQAARDQLSPLDKVLARRDAQLEKIRELEEVTGETAQSRAAAEAVVAQAIREAQEVRRSATSELLGDIERIASAAVGTAVKVTDAIGTFTEIQLDSLERTATAARAQLDATAARLSELNAAIVEEKDERVKAEIELEIALLEGLQAAQDNDLKRQQAEYVRQFNKRKKVEISGIIISGTAAAIAALAPPPIGAGPIIGAILAGGIAATTTAQVAKVRAQQPPQFHTGYAGYTDGGDELDARITRGETVNNPRATDALGGPQGVAELNATGRLGAPSRPRGLNPSELGRLLGQLVAQELDTGRELSRALNRGRPRAGVRPVYTR